MKPSTRIQQIIEQSEFGNEKISGHLTTEGAILQYLDEQAASNEREGEKECCKKCYANMGEGGGFNSACRNCPCHTPTNEEFLEKEVIKEFLKPECWCKPGYNDTVCPKHHAPKDFKPKHSQFCPSIRDCEVCKLEK